MLTLPVFAKPCNRVISKKAMIGNMMAVKALMGSQYSCTTHRRQLVHTTVALVGTNPRLLACCTCAAKVVETFLRVFVPVWCRRAESNCDKCIQLGQMHTFSPCMYHAGWTPKISWPRIPTTAIIAHLPLVFSPSANLKQASKVETSYPD